jgi:hypothetical protein
MPGKKRIIFDFSQRAGPESPHSYRGYYSDLAFSAGHKRTAGAWLRELESCLGSTFTGYKGGDFTMREDTPLWAAFYGCCGRAIIDLTPAGILITKEDGP